MRIIILLILSLLLNGCTQQNADNVPLKLPDGVNYHVTKNVVDRSTDKYLIHAELNKIIDKNTIKVIADRIRMENTEASNMILFLHLTGMSNVAWARVDYNPNYNLEIFGINQEEEKILEQANVDDIKGATVIGKWKDLSPLASKTLIIYEKSKTTYIRWYYADKSFSDIKLTKKDSKYEISDKKNYDEWYVIEDDGALSINSSAGKFSEAVPVR